MIASHEKKKKYKMYHVNERTYSRRRSVFSSTRELCLFCITEIRCLDTPEITNTALVNSSLHAAPSHPIGTTLTYACDDGYRFIDGSTVGSLVCDVTGQWTGIDSYGDGKYITSDPSPATICSYHVACTIINLR